MRAFEGVVLFHTSSNIIVISAVDLMFGSTSSSSKLCHCEATEVTNL